MSIDLKPNNMLAPIALIAFNRVKHFKQTLDALVKNKETKDSILYVCIDGPRNLEDEKSQKEMCRYLEITRLQFQDIKIIKQDSNIGLAKNIIQSVTNIVNRHGKLIVLEDDLLVSRMFLKFMNDALTHYEYNKKVWHIAGHTITNDDQKIDDVFLYRVMNCWGWGTWKNRWSHFEKNSEKLINEFTEEDIKNFNLDNTESFWSQVVDNHSGLLNTWAIFWYATIFKNKGLCMNPFYSYVKNIGFDGSGTHKNLNKRFQDSQVLNNYGEFKPQLNTEENLLAVERIKKYNLDKTNNFKKFIKLLIAVLFSKKLLRRLEALWRKIVN